MSDSIGHTATKAQYPLLGMSPAQPPAPPNNTFASPATPRPPQAPSSPLPPSRSRGPKREAVIGHVLYNKKFKCARDSCSDITFARQADLRRHFDHTHAPNRKLHYCYYEGCQRAQGGRNTGFKRKDKRDEHMRSVHKKWWEERQAQLRSPANSI
ncbi:hypothetical protein CC78DRAFT_303492 [Lojkania enalia]|uniref:C2H2-domain containing protein second zinc finger domain-containing protein n=1 Tax=Lojkania enalia TaxID=147567 RepID=A0A9P4TPR9_9PLEO|nr:hypothetical protein CC78DRAFT_303492 [Didymosphaeria enalia]